MFCDKDYYKIGSRQSNLAIKQTQIVLDALIKQFPCSERLKNAKIVPINTSGDKISSGYLADFGGKALFAKEIQAALIADEIDFAVHSLKDLETIQPKGLAIAAVLEREDYRDVLITKTPMSFEQLKIGSIVGTSSFRRSAQILDIRPDLIIKPLRGNVLTRIYKLLNYNDFDAIILAFAGIKRLKINNLHISQLPFMLPAAGQGVLAVECRANDFSTYNMLRAINHNPTEALIAAEKEFLACIGCNCKSAIGVLAKLKSANIIEISAVYYPKHPHMGLKIAQTLHGDINNPKQLGQNLASIVNKLI